MLTTENASETLSLTHTDSFSTIDTLSSNFNTSASINRISGNVSGIPENYSISTSGIPEKLEVISPANLPEGFKLKCMLKGEEFSVVVPQGGAKEGERFMGIVELNLLNIPNGRWRDGVCSCCAYGIWHPMCWYGWFCEPILLGQVMTRMGLNVCACRPSPPTARLTCRWMGIFWILWILGYVITTLVARPYYRDVQDHSQNQRLQVYIGVVSFFGVCYLYIFYLVIRTRFLIRTTYNIPGNICEDCFTGLFCRGCAVQQLARHTYDYKKYPIGCFSYECCCSIKGKAMNAP